MEPARKALNTLRSTLKLPASARPRIAGRPQTDASTNARDLLHQVLAQTLWPLVKSAFRDVDDHVESRVLCIDDLQLIVSRPPARSTGPRAAVPRLTLELWPAAGPRVLVVEWSGSRPTIVHRRAGDWLQRLATPSARSA